MSKGFGNRRIAACRELTKKFEEVYRGTIESAREYFQSPRGEFVLVVEGGEIVEEEISKETIFSSMEAWFLEGATTKDLVKRAVESYGVKKNQAYDWAMEIKEKTRGE
jgi:16S rRNA (cytidine1402-2'-O)-methyltransferase